MGSSDSTTEFQTQSNIVIHTSVEIQDVVTQAYHECRESFKKHHET